MWSQRETVVCPLFSRALFSRGVERLAGLIGESDSNAGLGLAATKEIIEG